MNFEVTRVLLSRAAWLLATVIVCSTAGLAQDPCAYNFPQDSNPTSITSEDACNFHQVDAQLFRGGRPRPSAYPKLVEIGIRTIVNLEEQEFAADEKKVLGQLNRTLPADRQIQFVSMPIEPDEIEVRGVSHRRLKELFAQLRDAPKPVFIHCYHGKDRTGAVVALYRMLMQQKSFEEAYHEAYHYGFSRRDHGLSKTVDRYRSRKKIQLLPRPGPGN